MINDFLIIPHHRMELIGIMQLAIALPILLVSTLKRLHHKGK
ncbi:MAG: hypothetical protein AB4290_24980 [Spirulina sp.]